MWWPFWKWRPVEIFRCQDSIRDTIIYPHMKCRWNLTMLNLCGIVAVILKMATGRHFSISWINLGHHNLPIYEMSLKSDNVEFVRYCGSPFWKWWPVEIFQCQNQFGTSLSTHISTLDDIGQCWIFTAHFLCRVLAAIFENGRHLQSSKLDFRIYWPENFKIRIFI